MATAASRSVITFVTGNANKLREVRSIVGKSLELTVRGQFSFECGT